MHRIAFTADQLRSLLAEAQAGGVSPEVTEKLQWFLHYTAHRCSVDETCNTFGISRATFHRWVKRFDPADLSTLEEKSRRPKSAQRRELDPKIVAFIVELRREQPFLGKHAIAQRVTGVFGAALSPTAVGRVIVQEGLYFGDTPLHRRKLAVHTQRFQSDVPSPPLTPLTQITPPPVPGHRVARIAFRSVLFGSLAANFLFVGFLLGTASWENTTASVREPIERPEPSEPESASGSAIAPDELDPDSYDEPSPYRQ